MRKMIVEASRALVGKTLEQAEEISFANRSVIRVVEQDGIPIGDDYSSKSNRINVSTDNGKISRVISIG